MASDARLWLYSGATNRVLGVACVVAVFSCICQILPGQAAIDHSALTATPSWFDLYIAALAIALISQLSIMISMMIHTYRHPAWNGWTKFLLIVTSITVFVSAGIYVFSYRPFALARAKCEKVSER